MYFIIRQTEDPTRGEPDRLNGLRLLLGPRFSVLAGAGTSFGSGLPLALPTAIEILKSIAADESELLELQQSLSPDHITVHGYHDFLRFETIFYALKTLHDPNLALLQELYSGGVPTLEHNIIARHAIRGNPVYTTNFDTLLEEVAPSVKTIINEAGFCAASPQGSFIAHLHGVLQASDGLGQPPLITVAEIRDDFNKSGAKWTLFADTLASLPVVVSGYSGSDDFDVMYAISRVGSSKPLVWIIHDPASAIRIINWRDLLEDGVGSEAIPRKLIHGLVKKFKDEPPRDLGVCFFVVGKTAAILEALTGVAVSAVFSPHPPRQVGSISLVESARAGVRATLFAGLGYSSWAQGIIERECLKTDEITLIKASCEMDALRLGSSADTYYELAKTSLDRGLHHQSIYCTLKMIEIMCIRLVTLKPTHRLAPRPQSVVLKDESKLRKRILERVGETEAHIAALEAEGGFQGGFYRDKLTAFRVLATGWMKMGGGIHSICHDLRSVEEQAILDPLILGLVYLINWSQSRTERDDSKLSPEAAEKRQQQHDSATEMLLSGPGGLRALFPPNIYKVPESSYPSTPAWRSQTWLPSFDRLRSLEYASEVFDHAGLRIWDIAAQMVLWDDEMSSGWPSFADVTNCGLVSHFTKAGEIELARLFARHFSGDLDPRVMKTIVHYSRNVVPIFGRFYWPGPSQESSPEESAPE